MYDVIASSSVTLGVIGWSKSHERFSTPVNFLSIFSRSLARASFSLRSLLDLRHVSAASITYCSFYSFFFLVIEFFLSTEICSNFWRQFDAIASFSLRFVSRFFYLNNQVSGQTFSSICLLQHASTFKPHLNTIWCTSNLTPSSSQFAKVNTRSWET